ncbi:MAG: acyltransferase family protein [Flavobacterium sp.]
MKDRLYFNNLNGLRFIAALMVIVSHLELNKSHFDLPNYFHSIKEIGRLGVSLFFVLSGFLITFLLVKEKEKNGFIGIKNFYLKRIYRIWPLYYVIVILALFVLPHFSIFSIPNMELEIVSTSRLVMIILFFVFFLTNILISIVGIPFAAQTWSIGTEEQFYLIWPIIINKFQKLKPIFFGLILAYNLVIISISTGIYDSIKYSSVFINFVFAFQLDCLTIGALAAYMLYCKSKIISILTHKIIFVLAILIIILLLVSHYNLGFLKSTIFAFLFVIVIINLVNHPKLQNLLENDVFNYLGQISYGLYMYHQIIIVVVLNCLLKFNLFNHFALYLISILLTIIVAGISYKFIEKPFLLLKEKLATFTNHK